MKKRIVKIRRTFNVLPNIYGDDETEEKEENYKVHNNLSKTTDDDILKGFLSINPMQLSINDSNSKKEKKKDKKKKKKKKKNKKDNEIRGFEDLHLFDNEKISPEEKKKQKENDDFYEYRFRGSLKLLTNLMQEINISTKDARDYLEKMKSGKVKASPNSITNQTSCISTLLANKLSTIKEITAVNSKISELELKKAAALEKSGKGKQDEEMNQKLLIDKMFDKILDSDATNIPEINDSYDELLSDGSKESEEFIEKSIDERIQELEDSGELEFTETERAFKYEKDNVRVCVKKNINNNRWEFVALNEDGDELFDYPLPNKKSIGRMKFDMDELKATDSMKREYDIIPVDSLNPDDEEMNPYGSHRGELFDNDGEDDDPFRF